MKTEYKTVLYINYEHCTSLAQFKGYFSEDLTPESDIYADLLDKGRHGDIAKWLDEQGYPELSSSVASISAGLSDSAFFAQLKGIVTGDPVPDSGSLKPAFGKCFSFEDLKCEVNDTEAKVRVILKVLLCVNEEYELRVSSDWGIRAMMVNPYSHPEGKSASFEFTFYKRPGKNIGEITVLADGKELSRSAKFSRGGDEITVGGVSFKMIRVEGGTFKMDSNYHVTLSSYYIGETQVTQELWQAVMGNNPSYFKEAQNPVEQVSWNDCQTFIKKLNQQTDRRFRLPTEAEWEFAARGGTKSNGFKYSGSNNLNDVAWYDSNSGRKTHPVKQKQPNELEIYDMSGNVWEWCQDWYGNYGSGAETNPTGPVSGSYRVMRGGSWNYDAVYCRLSYRCNCTPGFTYLYIGLRLVLSE